MKMQSSEYFLKLVNPVNDSVIRPSTEVIQVKDTDANINNADVVIIYGKVSGNINNCENVVVINGQVVGDICNCENVLGTLADDYEIIDDEPYTRW